jgi:hypothetical protein
VTLSRYIFDQRQKEELDCQAASALSVNPHWARKVGYGPFSLCVIHKEDLCPSSGDYIRLMMIITRCTIKHSWRGARWSSSQCSRRAIAEAKHRSQWPVLGWVTKIYYLELLRASEGTLSRWSRLHLQSLAPTPVSRRIDVTQAAGRKKIAESL